MTVSSSSSGNALGEQRSQTCVPGQIWTKPQPKKQQNFIDAITFKEPYIRYDSQPLAHSPQSDAGGRLHSADCPQHWAQTDCNICVWENLAQTQVDNSIYFQVERIDRKQNLEPGNCGKKDGDAFARFLLPTRWKSSKQHVTWPASLSPHQPVSLPSSCQLGTLSSCPCPLKAAQSALLAELLLHQHLVPVLQHVVIVSKLSTQSFMRTLETDKENMQIINAEGLKSLTTWYGRGSLMYW